MWLDVLVDLNGEDNDDKPDINFLPVPGYDNVRLDQCEYLKKTFQILTIKFIVWFENSMFGHFTALLPPPPTDFIPSTDQGQPEFMRYQYWTDLNIYSFTLMIQFVKVFVKC